MGLRRRPIIGVTGPDAGGAAAWWFTRFAVYLAGGRATRITPSKPCLIDKLDGLVIGGGADVDPRLYGEDPEPILQTKPRPHEAKLIFVLEWLLFPATWLARALSGKSAKGKSRRDGPRDTLELSLLAGAIEQGLPVLGICRGMQLVNVHFGGTLRQSLAGFYVESPEMRTVLPRKTVRLQDGSLIARLMGRRPHRVNALHHQGVDELGDDLRIGARDLNGIIQSIEHCTLPFVLGVQWHPEYLPQIADQRAIFRGLVAAASARVPHAGSEVFRKPGFVGAGEASASSEYVRAGVEDPR